MNFTATRTRLAAALVVAGLAIEGITLNWAHPTAFLVFVGIGALVLAVGVLIFLTALLGRSVQ